MKKYVVWLVLIALAIGGLGTYAYLNKDYYQESLFQQQMPLSYLSKEVADEADNLYVISDSQQKLLKISRDGVLQYTIQQSKADGNHRYLYTDIAVDSQQRLYVLNTELDGYGLYVLSEEIVRYDSSGKMDKLVHRIAYDDKTKMLRIGNIKSLQVKGDTLYFFIENKQEMKQYAFDGNSGILSSTLNLHLPENRYLSQIVGVDPDAIYYSTKRGAIYRLAEGQVTELLYPVESGKTRLNFPYSLQVDENQRIYYIDQSTNEIGRIDTKNHNQTQMILSKEQMAQFLAATEDWEMTNMYVKADGSLDVLFSEAVLRISSDMATFDLLEEAKYSTWLIIQKWLHWGLLAILAALVYFFIKIFYEKVMKRRISLMIKNAVVFVLIVVVSMVFLSNFIYQSYSARLGQEMMRELVQLAKYSKHIIDGDVVERFTSPQDFMNEDYKVIKKSMNFIFEDQESDDRRGIYSTLYKYENDRFYLIADDDDGVNMFKSYPLTEQNRRVVETGNVESEFWEDETGSWMYAIAPVYNSAGKIVGVYETGRDMNVLQQSNASIFTSVIQIILITTAIMLLIFLLMTYYLLSSLRKLRESVTDMANGNWFSEVHIRTRDEIAELGEQFNYMAGHIRKYIANLTNFSEASSRFVPQQFLSYLGKYDILDIKLGDQVQSEMVVMVSNIRSFYLMSKQMTPKDIFNFMNSFLRRFGPIVRNNDGLISKYLGAGFMSLFPNDPQSTLKAAIEIRKELISFNEHREKSGYAPVDIGIAIHKGPMMLGIIGEEKRMEGSVISDSVNTATILEKMTESLGVSILISEQALLSIRNHESFQYRCLGRISIEGRDQGIVLYDVFEGDESVIRANKEKTKELFERGISLYQEGRFHDAREAFVEVIKLDRFDKTAKLYFYLCDEYSQKGTIAGWNGSLAVS